MARRGEWWGDLWSERNLSAVYYRHYQERAIIAALNDCGIELADADVLDVGCGNGWVLRFLASLRANPARFHGIDLVPERIEFARLHSPRFHLQVGDATALPYPDRAFDLVCQFTALSSFTTAENRKGFADEMARVLRPGGRVLWFEIARQLPGARTLAVSASELRSLFQGFDVIHERGMFHLWTARLARWPTVCAAVESLSIAKTNSLAILRQRPV